MKKKENDWNGHTVKLVASAFNLAKGLGVQGIHLNAASENEAKYKLDRKLERHQDFLRKTEGDYQVRFERVFQGPR